MRRILTQFDLWLLRKETDERKQDFEEENEMCNK